MAVWQLETVNDGALSPAAVDVSDTLAERSRRKATTDTRGRRCYNPFANEAAPNFVREILRIEQLADLALPDIDWDWHG